MNRNACHTPTKRESCATHARVGGNGADFPCYLCYAGFRASRRETGRFSMLHMLHGVARVARRIGGFRGAGLAVLCSMCSIMQNRVPSKAGLAVLAYRMSIIVARGSQAVSVHLRHPMLLA